MNETLQQYNTAFNAEWVTMFRCPTCGVVNAANGMDNNGWTLTLPYPHTAQCPTRRDA